MPISGLTNAATGPGFAHTEGGGLSKTLHAQFVDWAEQRKPQEQNMIEDYEHKMRVVREGSDQLDTGLAKPQKSRVFVGSTRSKIRSARARIKDVLFGAGRMPFDAEPTQEQLAPYVSVVEKILTHQFDTMKWVKTVCLGVDDLATYGTGFIGGPFTRTETYNLHDGGQELSGSKSINFRAPYFERISPMDGYVDPEAETIQDGVGFYWGSHKDPGFIRRLLDKPGYKREALLYALTQKTTARTDEGSDRTKDSRQNLYRYSKEGRIWFIRYFGLVSVKELAEWRGLDADGIDPEERIEAIVQMAGGVAIKADVNPYRMMRRPIYRCAYEDEPGEMWGTGIARNNRDNQKVINASFQLYLEGKAFALLKMCSIDRSKFSLTEDFKLFPGKKFDMQMGLSPEERKSAIIWHDIVDVTKGWENAIALSEKFSDDDTGITKYTQGSDSETLNKTATGISMIMNAASLPAKEVIGNIDEDWIEPMVNDLFQWCLEFLDPATVAAQVGQEAGEAWAKIKEFGQASFVTLKPAGSSTFMMREVLLQKLTGFITIALGNPLTAQFVDVRELLQQVWDSVEIGKESPVLSEQEVMQRLQTQGVPPGGAQGVAEPAAQPQPQAMGAEPSDQPQSQEPLDGIRGISPPNDTAEETEAMMEKQATQRLEALMMMLLAKQDEANRIAAADKVPIRDPATGLIERVTVVSR